MEGGPLTGTPRFVEDKLAKQLERRQKKPGMLAEHQQRYAAGRIATTDDAVQSGRTYNIIDEVTEAAMAGQRPPKPNNTKLIDMILRGGNNRITDAMMQRLQHTKNFVLDKSASEFMGDLVKRAAVFMLEQHRWARGPFPLCWVEMDHRAYWYSLGQPQGGTTTDTRLGFLWDNGRVMEFVEAEGDIGMQPYYFEFGRPMSLEEELEIAEFFGVSRLGLRMNMLGSTTGVLDPWWSSDALKSIFRENTIRMLPAGREVLSKVPRERRVQLLQSSAGDLKLAIIAFLLLCRPHSSLVISDHGHERKLVKGRAMVLKAHSKITMRIEHTDPVKRFVSSFKSGVHRQRHDVRGHWAQTRRGVYRCEHKWEEVDADHFFCLQCNAKRWWRIAHQRGRSQIGVKTGEYEVTQ